MKLKDIKSVIKKKANVVINKITDDIYDDLTDLIYDYYSSYSPIKYRRTFTFENSPKKKVDSVKNRIQGSVYLHPRQNYTETSFLNTNDILELNMLGYHGKADFRSEDIHKVLTNKYNREYIKNYIKQNLK